MRFDEIEREFVTIPVEKCEFGYRSSMFKQPDNKDRYIIHAVDYRLSSSAKPNISYPALAEKFKDIDPDKLNPSDIRKAVIEIRDSKLPNPQTTPSAGSFFKNPIVSEETFRNICDRESDVTVPHYKVEDGVKIPAAWLIDRCGWKGKTEGM